MPSHNWQSMKHTVYGWTNADVLSGEHYSGMYWMYTCIAVEVNLKYSRNVPLALHEVHR